MVLVPNCSDISRKIEFDAQMVFCLCIKIHYTNREEDICCMSHDSRGNTNLIDYSRGVCGSVSVIPTVHLSQPLD